MYVYNKQCNRFWVRKISRRIYCFINYLYFYQMHQRLLPKSSLVTKIVLIFAGLLSLIITDCPLALYPRFTTIAHIHAQIGQDPYQHDSPLIYQYPLSESIEIQNQQTAQTASNCLVSVNGLSMSRNAQYQEMGFNIRVIKAQPSLYYGKSIQTTVSFQITVRSFRGSYGNMREYQWNYLTFNFLHSRNPQLYLDTISSSNVKPSSFPYAYRVQKNIISPSKNRFNIEKIIPQVYISGIHIKEVTYQASDYVYDLQGTIKKLQELKKYAWNVQLIDMFKKTLQDQKIPSLYIKDLEVQQKSQGSIISLNFNIQTSSSIQLLDFSYSFLLYLQKQQGSNIYTNIIGEFWASNNHAHYYDNIRNNGMFVIGISGFRYNYLNGYHADSQFELSLSYGQEPGSNYGQNRYLIHSKTQNGLSQFLLSYFAIQIAPGLSCQDCPGSPFIFQDYCVAECPVGYIYGSNEDGGRECVSCNATNYFVPNSQKQSCVCASNYYLQTPTLQCSQCPRDCLTCNGNKCLTCDNSQALTKRKLNIYTNRCECPKLGDDGIGYYDDIINNQIVCQKCSPRCQTCLGSAPNQCQSCSSDRQLFRGYCICPPNFRQNKLGKCECQSPYQLSYNNRCQVVNYICGQNQYYRGGRNPCECLPNFFRNILTGQCVPNCAPYQQFSYEKNQCICLTGLIYNNKTKMCFSCQSRPFQYFNPATGSCQCINSQYSYNYQTNQCIKCPPKSYYDFKDGNCKCIFNYFMNNGTCLKCKNRYEGDNCYIGDIAQIFLNKTLPKFNGYNSRVIQGFTIGSTQNNIRYNY